MRTRAHAQLFFATILLAACGADQGTVLLRDDIPEPPANGAQLVSPTFTVPAGSEVFMCMRLPFEVTEDMFVNKTSVWQVAGGHHTLLYFGQEAPGTDPEPHECTGFEMAGSVNFLGTGSADGSGFTLPAGIALKMAAGEKIFIQSHYLNTTDRDLLAQDVINLSLIAANEVTQVAGAYANVDLTFSVPASGSLSRTLECSPPSDIKIPFLLAHMHEHGSHYAVEVVRGSPEQVVWSWETDWAQALRDDFPIIDFAPALDILSTDIIRTTCTWTNPNTTPLIFPSEMCATFMPFWPSNGEFIACDETGTNFYP